MPETKEERFIRIAEARTNRIISQLRLLGNCSNKGNYSYTDADVKKIFSAIESELKAAKSKFTEADTTEKTFKLH